VAVLKACVNGARGRAEHPALPVTAGQLARDVAAVATAGADAVHLHVKDHSGADTLAASALDEVMVAVRDAAPGLPVGVTTGAWAMPDPRERVAAVRAWRELPDFASVNWHEQGAEDVAAALLEVGVAVEAGIWHIDAAARWAASPYRDRCIRILLELPDGLPGAAVPQEASRLLRAVTTPHRDGSTVLLHGEGSSAWPALQLAGQLVLATRIGLEDTLTLPDGSPAPDNATLVHAARALLSG
jgi:uncharacterized protein (DUF849 family)